MWVHTETLSPTCCEWLAKQLISKYPVLADADPRSMLAKEQSGLKENFRYWVRFFMSCLRAVCCKDQLRSCNIEKTDFPKLCQNKGLGELVLKI